MARIIWDPEINMKVGCHWMVGLYHRIISLQLIRDDANGVDYNEFKASSKAAKASDGDKFCRPK